MFKIQVLNNISDKGLSRFPADRYDLSETDNPDAILLRSHQMSVEEIDRPAVRAIGRAGAGVNNIPVDACTERGVVVFNTPGANANAVKELVMAGLLLSRRGIIQGMEYVNTLSKIEDKAELNKLVEASKKQYKGSELKGRTLGVLGLGAIGSMVARMALSMDMEVVGYDPALSVEAAWRLPSQVQKMDSMQMLFSRADIVTLHVPALEETRGMVNAEALANFKPGSVLLNFAREEIVDTDAILQALESGQLSQYISDFPNPKLIGHAGVLSTPHLGASTAEAEENCAMMVADQVMDFLDNGNIRNSVNFPALVMERSGGYRITLSNNNVPRILGSVLSILADRNLNVLDMLNKSRDNIAYNIIDVETEPSSESIDEIAAIDGVINVRLIGAA